MGRGHSLNGWTFVKAWNAVGLRQTHWWHCWNLVHLIWCIVGQKAAKAVHPVVLFLSGQCGHLIMCQCNNIRLLGNQMNWSQWWCHHWRQTAHCPACVHSGLELDGSWTVTNWSAQIWVELIYALLSAHCTAFMMLQYIWSKDSINWDESQPHKKHKKMN